MTKKQVVKESKQLYEGMRLQVVKVGRSWNCYMVGKNDWFLDNEAEKTVGFLYHSVTEKEFDEWVKEKEFEEFKLGGM